MQTAILSPFQYLFYPTETTQAVLDLPRGSSSLTDQIKDIIYIYPNANQTALESFLRNNFSIINYILEAPDQIKNYFGNNIKINPKVVFDPEIENDNGTLFINIETSEELDSAMKKLDSLTKEWLIPTVGKDITKFNVDLDFT